MSNKVNVKEKSLLDIIKPQLITILKYSLGYLAALIFWEILLRSQIGFDDFNLYFLFFLPAEALFLAALTGWLKPSLNRITTPIIMVLPFIFYIVQLIYFRIFGSMFSVSMIGMGTDAVENFGWALWDSIKGSIGWILLCLLPVIACAVFSYMAPKRHFKRYCVVLHVGSFLGVVILWCLAVLMLLPFGKGSTSPYAAYSSSSIDTDTASSRLGILTNSVVELGYSLFGSAQPEEPLTLVVPQEEPQVDSSPNIINTINFNTLKGLTNDAGKQELCDYFAAISGTNKNEYTGKLKDYNLIYICAESFSNYAIDPVVTPTLYKLSTGGFVLNNYYNSFRNTTTNGEFAFMTGLWPDVSRDANSGSYSGSFAQSSKKLLPFALGNMFEKAGVKTYNYHNFKGYYYNRATTHPNLGYTTNRFMGGENGMKFTTSWPSSDLEMMEQSVSDYINNPRFHAYYMSFSGHGPYSTANPICVKNIKTVRELTKDRDLPDVAEYYLAANMELDKAMEYLLNKLFAAGKLNETLIVITGDHYPYYLPTNTLSAFTGEKVDTNFGIYKSSCIMWCGGMNPVQVDTPCCNVDILPTVLNLLGMEYDSRLLPGTDIFSNNRHIAMLYNKSFVTDTVKYNAQNGKTEWLAPAAQMNEQQKKDYLNYCIATTKSRYSVSLQLMNEDFYRFVFENTP